MKDNKYFGSVKFFKHLIYTVFFSWLAAATFLAVLFGILYGTSKDKAVPADVTAETDVPEKMVIPDGESLEHIFLAMTAKGYSVEEMLPLIEKSNEEAFAGFAADYIAEHPELSPAVTPETAEDALVGAGILSEPYMKLYPDLYVEDPVREFKEDTVGTVYLTFDDGPSDRTLEILDILDEYDIKATFFFCGGNDEKEQMLMKRVADAGHSIGIHSISHDYEKIYASVESYLDDFYETYMSVYNATGIKPRIFRFPGGSINNYNRFTYMQIIAEMTRRGFVYYDWNVSGEDSVKGADWTSVYNNIVTGMRYNPDDKAIILLHDSQNKHHTVNVLNDIIERLEEEGYTFDKLDDSVRPAVFTYAD